jgi:hypothetical protein
VTGERLSFGNPMTGTAKLYRYLASQRMAVIELSERLNWDR